MKIKTLIKLAIFSCLSILIFAACGDIEIGDLGIGESESSYPMDGDRDATPVVYVATADGTDVIEGTVSIIDISNIDQGYVMIKYTGTADKIKMQLRFGGEEPYTYDLDPTGNFETFPITQGSGSYTITINENIQGTTYAVVDTASFNVSLSDDHVPFLYPNQYVQFNENSAIVAATQKIATGAVDDIDVVIRVYDNVAGNIEYDVVKAENIESFYLPDVDKTYETKKGICFDYAALMTAMLRTQGIPTQLVIGYAGTAYHAWISVYTPETGWLENVIQFDGENWTRLDPTFAATGDGNPDLLEYIGDGENYNAMFFY